MLRPRFTTATTKGKFPKPTESQVGLKRYKPLKIQSLFKVAMKEYSIFMGYLIYLMTILGLYLESFSKQIQNSLNVSNITITFNLNWKIGPYPTLLKIRRG
jgi:hypothetical protein